MQFFQRNPFVSNQIWTAKVGSNFEGSLFLTKATNEAKHEKKEIEMLASYAHFHPSFYNKTNHFI